MKKVEFKIKALIDTVELEIGEDGFSLWFNDKWILDASTICRTGDLSLDTNKFDHKESGANEDRYHFNIMQSQRRSH